MNVTNSVVPDDDETPHPRGEAAKGDSAPQPAGASSERLERHESIAAGTESRPPQAARGLIPASPGQLAVRDSHVLIPDAIEKFLTSCGRSEPPRVLVQVAKEANPSVFTFDRPFALVGSAGRCDLRCEHPDISHRHAYVQLVEGRLVCFDLGSRTGMFWRGGLRSVAWLTPNDPLSMGPLTISAQDGVDGSLDTSIMETAGNSTRERLPEVYVERRDGPASRRRPTLWQLERPVNLVGWSAPCHVRVKGGDISRVHCSFVLTPSGVWLVDLLGRGGTQLNGRRVNFAHVREGSELIAGSHRFFISFERPRPRQARLGARNGTIDPPAGSPRNPGAEPAAGQADSRGREASAANTGAALTPVPTSGLSENFVLSLVDRFASMQQEILAQGQQQVMFLAQMLGTLHHKQQELIWHHLRRVSEIDQQIQRMHSRVIQQERGGNREPDISPRTDAGDLSCDGPALAGRAEIEGPAAVGWSRNGDRNEDVVDAMFEFVSDESDVFPLEPERDSEVAESRETTRSAPPPESELSPFDPSHPPEAGEPLGRPGADTHAWLNQRVQKLQRERQSRWQKVLSLLGGRPGG